MKLHTTLYLTYEFITCFVFHAYWLGIPQLLNTSSEVPSPKSVIVQFHKLFGFVYSNFWRRPKPPRLPMLRLRVKYGTTLSPCLLHAKACTFHMNLRKERKKEEHNKKETRQ